MPFGGLDTALEPGLVRFAAAAGSGLAFSPPPTMVVPPGEALSACRNSCVELRLLCVALAEPGLAAGALLAAPPLVALIAPPAALPLCEANDGISELTCAISASLSICWMRSTCGEPRGACASSAPRFHMIFKVRNWDCAHFDRKKSPRQWPCDASHWTQLSRTHSTHTGAVKEATQHESRVYAPRSAPLIQSLATPLFPLVSALQMNELRQNGVDFDKLQVVQHVR